MPISIREIAEKFELSIVGNDSIEIEKITDLNNQFYKGLSWIKNYSFIKDCREGTFLIGAEISNSLPKKNNLNFLITNNSPKLIFSKIIQEHFSKPKEYFLENHVENYTSRDDITLGSNVFIGKNVTIGPGSVIEDFTKIEADSIIGSNFHLRSFSSIGTFGMGLEFDSKLNAFVSFPQIGNVVIENNVHVGPHSTIRRGALISTTIKSGNRIGSMVNIGHNCEIGENCIFTSQVTLAGSIKVGKRVTFGVGSTIRNGINIGENSEIGMGAVVTKDVTKNSIQVGNPARLFRTK